MAAVLLRETNPAARPQRMCATANARLQPPACSAAVPLPPRARAEGGGAGRLRPCKGEWQSWDLLWRRGWGCAVEARLVAAVDVGHLEVNRSLFLLERRCADGSLPTASWPFCCVLNCP